MPQLATGSFSGRSRTETEADVAAQAWVALRRHLEARNREINFEVAHYPTPIARCDVQLSKLLEQRARVYRLLARMEEIGDPPCANGARGDWIRGVEGFISETEPDREDEVEVSLRADLIRAVWRLNQRINS